MTEKALKHIIHGTPESEKQLSDAVYTAREIQKRLKLVFFKYYVKSAYLFGDYAKRNATPTSEVDILFESELSEMERRGFQDFVQEIADTLGKNVNLLNARRIDQESKKKIQKTGIQIYSVNKRKLIRIILLSLYAPFSLFCICFAIHAILGPDSIRYYAWVGACTFVISIGSLTRTAYLCHTHYKNEGCLINVLLYLLTSIVLLFISIWLGIILLIAAILHALFHFLVATLEGMSHGSCDGDIELAHNISNFSDTICTVNVYAVLIMTICFMDPSPILLVMGLGGFVFPIVFYLKRKIFLSSYKRDDLRERSEKIETRINKRNALKNKLKGLKRRTSLRRRRKFIGIIHGNRCFMASHKFVNPPCHQSHAPFWCKLWCNLRWNKLERITQNKFYDKFRHKRHIFTVIRQNDSPYVDKTALIYELTHYMKYNFLARPSLFGKTLLLSTIKAYFEGKKELFEGLAISQLEKEWLKYPVLYLNLMSIRDQYDSDLLHNTLSQALENWESLYGIENPAQTESVRFSNVIEQAKVKTGREVIILIDEYEFPILDTIDKPELQEQMRQTLNEFYRIIKTCDEHIRFVLFTGIAKISDLSVFSTLNDLNEITFDPKFATLCGITENELHQFFKPYIQELSEYMHLSYNTMAAQLKIKYDGYHFAANSECVYNPYSLLSVFYHQKLDNYWFVPGTPDFLINPNTRWYGSGTPTFLAKLCKQQKFLLEDLYNCRRTEEQLKEIAAYERDAITQSDIITLFYQCGYLTIKGPKDELGRLLLGFPNKEVERSMLDFFVPFYSNAENTTHFKENKTNIDIRIFVKDLKKASIDSFMTCISTLLSGITYEIEHDLEVHLRNFFFLLFKLMGYYVDTEYHASAGCIDVVVKTHQYIYIFEFKIARSAQAVLDQMIQNHGADPFMSDPRKKFMIGANFHTELHGMGEYVIKDLENENEQGL